MSTRIFIVDDEEDIVKILAAQLEQRGFEVESALSSREALEKIKDRPPDLIILDIMMPEMDGTELAAHLKEEKATANIPIIFLSALQTKEEERSAGSEVGQNNIFAKPYDIDALVGKIKELTA